MAKVIRLILLFILFVTSQSGITATTEFTVHQYDVNHIVLVEEIYSYDATENPRCCRTPSAVKAQDRSLIAFVSDFIVTKGAKTANLSPPGAGRSGAFNEAKRQSDIPTSQQPSRILPNVDKRGNPQPGRIYEYEVPAPGGGTKTVRIRDDAGGHDFGPGNAQNRGPHFNDEAGSHYDY